MQSLIKPRCTYKVSAYGRGNHYRCHRAAKEGQQYCWQHAKKMAKEAERGIATTKRNPK